MAISKDQFEKIATMLVALPGGANPVPTVRASFPDLTVTRCDADDMRDETPFCRVGDYDVFMVGTINFCWKIINEPANATGLVLAARS